MLVESSNPAHSLADSPRMPEALDALELVVVIDVAMTETARHADYVLPAASQYEKCEATFFNLEFPRQHLPAAPPTARATGGDAARAGDLRPAAARARCAPRGDAGAAARRCARWARPFAQAFVARGRARSRASARSPPYVLYETLGPTLPEGLAGAAALWGLAHRCAMTYPDAVRRAGHEDGDALFDAILAARSGLVFTLRRLRGRVGVHGGTPTGGSALDVPELLDGARDLQDRQPGWTTAEFPIVLSAGERRAYTANDIFRDAGWRKRDAARRAADESRRTPRSSGLVDGDRARITTARGSAEALVEVNDAMLPGHASLPNGYGVRATGPDGTQARSGRRAERADLVGLARRVRRHAVAQARPRADRAGGGVSRDTFGSVDRRPSA